MKVWMDFLFSVNGRQQQESIDRWVREELGPEQLLTDGGQAGIDGTTYYSLRFQYDHEGQWHIYRRLKEAGVRSGPTYTFEFETTEWEEAPYLMLLSSGNSHRAFLEDRGTLVTLEPACEACGVYEQKPVTPLAADTSVLRDRVLVNGGAGQWVISGEMADWLERRGATGYRLEPLLHQGGETESQPAYRLVVDRMLPVSPEQQFLYRPGEEHCASCGKLNRIYFPYHLEKDALAEPADFALPEEPLAISRQLYRPLFLSRRLYEWAVADGLTSRVKDLLSFGERDWLVHPTIAAN
ncbi:hypothetical protein J31TS4_43730 [Paenibacillus sp. J31TS4]|uniref:hypothetical protein n=1 Tax=Paenibacillus sp. J31TS4 TaxID=2807195 RepID=UPI001B22D1CC|nr:hypothetical protein [Paenibacillus sp. J31TS4]GIP41093.1 hypothetical protein J31TS4_43730 [Paenibacillus sp. J31TS4]